MSFLYRCFAVLLVLSGILSLFAVSRRQESPPATVETVTGEVPSAKTAAPGTGAVSMVLMDLDSGAVLAAKNADERLPMASTTKIMTALVVLELLPLDTVVTVPPEAVGVEGSSIYLFAGEEITVENLLWGLLLSSANDAAVALAIATSGSVADFAAKMNEKAVELELTDTHFENPNGLHAEGHYTTARELARITLAAMKNETFATMVSTVRHSAAQNGTDASRLFVNHNRLLHSYEGTIGVKTGYTRAAGRCLVSAAERDGLRLVAVTLNDGSDWADHKALFEWGFANFARFTAEVPAVTLPVVGGSTNEVSLCPTESYSVLLPAEHGEIDVTVEAPRFLWGGCEQGEILGRAIFKMDGEVLCTIPLAAAETVEPLRVRRTLWERIKDVFIK